jgi:hypothetical protein
MGGSGIGIMRSTGEGKYVKYDKGSLAAQLASMG